MFTELIHARPRLVLLALGGFSLLAVAVAALLGHFLELEVCAMCWFQRIALVVAGCGFMLAAAWPRVSVLTLRLGELGLLIGLVSAARQSWLLANPAEASGSCGAGLMYYWQIGQYEAFLQAGLLGGVDCAVNQPLLFGLYFPQWSLLAFSGIAGLYLIWRVTQWRAGPLR